MSPDTLTHFDLNLFTLSSFFQVGDPFLCITERRVWYDELFTVVNCIITYTWTVFGQIMFTRASGVFRKSQSLLFLLFSFFFTFIFALLGIRIFLSDPFLGIIWLVHCSQTISFLQHPIFIQSVCSSHLGYKNFYSMVGWLIFPRRWKRVKWFRQLRTPFWAKSF